MDRLSWTDRLLNPMGAFLKAGRTVGKVIIALAALALAAVFLLPHLLAIFLSVVFGVILGARELATVPPVLLGCLAALRCSGGLRSWRRVAGWGAAGLALAFVAGLLPLSPPSPDGRIAVWVEFGWRLLWTGVSIVVGAHRAASWSGPLVALTVATTHIGLVTIDAGTAAGADFGFGQGISGAFSAILLGTTLCSAGMTILAVAAGLELGLLAVDRARPGRSANVLLVTACLVATMLQLAAVRAHPP